MAGRGGIAPPTSVLETDAMLISLPAYGAGGGSLTRATCLENRHANVTPRPHAETDHLFPRRSASFSTVQPDCQTNCTLSSGPATADGVDEVRKNKKPRARFPGCGVAAFRFFYIFRAPTPRLVLSCGSEYHSVFPCKQGRVKPITSEDFARARLVPVWACMIIEVSYLLA